MTPRSLGTLSGQRASTRLPEKPVADAQLPRPIRLLIVDTAIAFGGTLAVARNLLRHLDSKVIHASLLSACSDGFVSRGFAGDVEIRLLAPRVDYVTLARWKHTAQKRFRWSFLRRAVQLMAMMAKILGNFPYLVRLIRLYRALHLDVVHINNYSMEPIWAARLAGIPIVYHLHGFVHTPLDGSGRRNLRHVNAFVSISRAVTDSAVQAGIDRTRIHEIPNFVESAPEVPPPLPAQPAIGIFGRVTQWKGQKEFLLAAMRLLPSFPELRVYVVGDASDTDPRYMNACREIARSSPFAHQFQFAGLVTDVTCYYNKCTVIVHASTSPEPFGMVLIEAMAQGRPVVASVYGAPPEIIQDGVDGFLVDPKDTVSLTARISELLSDPALATRMGAKGYEKVRTRYDPCAAARKFERVYIEAAQARTRSSQ